MTESEAKLIESMADDYSNVIKEAKSMGCKEIRALYNIPIKNMEMIVQALEKKIPKKPHKNFEKFSGVWCSCGKYLGKGYFVEKPSFCSDCGQKLDWSDENEID